MDSAHANNSTSNVTNPTDQVLTKQMIVSGSLLFFSILTVVLSTLVLFVILKSRQLHNATGLILGDAALSYWLLGMSRVGLEVAVLFPKLPCGWAHIFFATYSISKLVCLMNITLLTIDRCVAISRPLHYVKIITPRKIKITLMLFWVINAIVYGPIVYFGIPRFTKDVFGCHPQLNFNILSSFFIHALSSCVITVTCYIHIIHIMKKRPNVTHPFTITKSRYKLHSAKSLVLPFIMMTTFVISNIPAIIFFQINYETTLKSSEMTKFNRFDYAFIKLADNIGYLINLILFILTYRPFKRALVKLFCRTLYRQSRARIVLGQQGTVRCNFLTDNI